MVTMVTFILGIFYQNFKNWEKRVAQKGVGSMLGGQQLHHPGTFTVSFQLKNEHCSLPTFTGLPLTSASGRPAGGGGC